MANKVFKTIDISGCLVPGAGIEPARCRHRGILSPVRLPVPPPRHKTLEAPVGFEPTHEGFADPCLTTWLRRHGAEDGI